MYYSISKRDLEYTYFFIGYKNLEEYYMKERFLEKAKVRKGSYAEVLISRIYTTILSDIVDLKVEYSKFYSNEYINFQEFLYQKYFIEYNEMELWGDYLKDDKTIYFGDLVKNDGYEISILLSENKELVNRINKIFKECSNEN